MKKIFQYDYHGKTFWIAAESQAAANKYAASKGWRSVGGEIFQGQSVPQTRPELRNFGCGVIIEGDL